MEYRKLGSTGLKVSVVGLGCNNFGMRIDAEQTKAVVGACLDEGINFFDTADVYGGTKSEEFLGAAIRGMDRDRLIIATKFAMPHLEGRMKGGASRHYINAAVEASLRRLGTDYIDLYQQHAPDADTPIEETLRALDDLVRAGKVRYLGNSNFNGWQLADADWTARHHGLNPFVTAQNHWNLLDRRVEKDVVPACRHFGLGILPYFPLASGLLTGKYRRGETPGEDTRLANFGARGLAALSDDNFDRVEALQAWVEQEDRTLLELAMSWLVSDPVVSSVIAGATRPEQVAANVAAASWRLTPEQMSKVAELTAR
ncbi:MAG TPA: aldo/keto reductase [Pseudomonadales bacterium]|nr:aldo/keto reductase [Pseudomonadales bacterium]